MPENEGISKEIRPNRDFFPKNRTLDDDSDDNEASCKLV